MLYSGAFVLYNLTERLRMKKKWIAAIILYIALVIICITVVYAVPSVRGLLEKTYVTEYGRVDITDAVTAYIVRDETVYVAAFDCKINRLAEPGSSLRRRQGSSNSRRLPIEARWRKRQRLKLPLHQILLTRHLTKMA